MQTPNCSGNVPANILQRQHTRSLVQLFSLVRWASWCLGIFSALHTILQPTCIFESNMLGLGAQCIVNLKWPLSLVSEECRITHKSNVLFNIGGNLIVQLDAMNTRHNRLQRSPTYPHHFFFTAA